MKLLTDYNIQHIKSICEIYNIDKLFKAIMLMEGDKNFPVSVQSHALIALGNAYQMAELVIPKSASTRAILCYFLIQASGIGTSVVGEDGKISSQVRQWIIEYLGEDSTLSNQLNSIYEGVTLLNTGSSIEKEPLWLKIINDAEVAAIISDNWYITCKELLHKEIEVSPDEDISTLFINSIREYVNQAEECKTYIDIFKLDFSSRLNSLKIEVDSLIN